jgi:very-short-patch-repair endonuclease
MLFLPFQGGGQAEDGYWMDGQTNDRILNQGLQRALRKNMSDAERKMWEGLRRRQISGYKFRRQHPYDRYILDFVCLDRKLVIEIDGGQHSESIRYDEERTQLLTRAGFRVLRFWNHEVLT